MWVQEPDVMLHRVRHFNWLNVRVTVRQVQQSWQHVPHVRTGNSKWPVRVHGAVHMNVSDDCYQRLVSDTSWHSSDRHRYCRHVCLSHFGLFTQHRCPCWYWDCCVKNSVYLSPLSCSRVWTFFEALEQFCLSGSLHVNAESLLLISLLCGLSDTAVSCLLAKWLS